MKLIHALRPDELSEVAKLPQTPEGFAIHRILDQNIMDLTIGDIQKLCHTNIFDASFEVLLFEDLFNRQRNYSKI